MSNSNLFAEFPAGPGSEGFPTGCIADFQAGRMPQAGRRPAGWKPAIQQVGKPALRAVIFRLGGRARLRLVLAAGFLVCAGLAGCVTRHAATPARVASSPSAPPAPAPVAPKEAADDLAALAAKPSLPFEGGGWQSMFNGENLNGWKETAFAGHGEVECRSGLLVFNMGDPFTGVNWTNDFPKMNYEVAFDAMRVMGTDFFCGLTVPVGDSFCSLIVGGWGGALVGISSVDGMDASENETMKYFNLESRRWYRIRLRVTQHRIEAWLDNDRVVNLDTTGRRLSVRPGDIELSQPVGLASWQTAAAFRDLKVRRLEK